MKIVFKGHCPLFRFLGADKIKPCRKVAEISPDQILGSRGWGGGVGREGINTIGSFQGNKDRCKMSGKVIHL
jgi:hypothetical protein